ncbi:hypothetical protein [Gaoshiqia sp. Z1-71]|uniref:hypothetical protein n=1 Tax=Gaoshiqia hydrogeniformans TaxID=3290090 RepID=UPI003BF90923
MRILHLIHRARLMAFVVIFTLCFSCDKDDEEALYNGTWETQIAYPGTDPVLFRHKIELYNAGYTESFPVHYAQGISQYNIWQGKVAANGNTLSFLVTNMKAYNYNPETGEVLDLISEEKPSLPYRQAYGILSWETVRYDINDGNLMIKLDRNEDGDYDDLNESLTYTPSAKN